MARDLIQMRRGLRADLPTLAQGELGYTIDTKELFIGGIDGNSSVTNVIKIGGVDGTDITDKVQAALDIGKNIIIELGNYVMDEVTIPATSRGIIIAGSGLYHYSDANGTNIKAKYENQNSIFKLADGVDGVTFANLKIDGDGLSLKGIDGRYGSFLTLETVGVYRTKNYGLYSQQGLARLSKCFFGDNEEVGYHSYSDATISDCEFTGGKIPLKIVAGGSRFSNVLVNSGSEHCVMLKPFDESTTHINTAFSNCYIGEVAGVNKSLMYAENTGVQRVRQVQLDNVHFIAAALPEQKVDMIKLVNCDDWVIGNIPAYGYGAYADASRWVKSFIDMEGCDRISLNNIICYGINQHPFNIRNCGYISLGTITVHAVGGDYAFTQAEKSAINISQTARFTVQELYVYSVDPSVVAINGDNGNGHYLNHLYYDFPNATRIVYTTNAPSFISNDAGGMPTFTGTFKANKTQLFHAGNAADPTVIFSNGAGIFPQGANGIGFSDGSTIKAYLMGDQFINDKGDFRTTGNGKGLIMVSDDGTITRRIKLNNAGELEIVLPN